jgi:hypothetical protein
MQLCYKTGHKTFKSFVINSICSDFYNKKTRRNFFVIFRKNYKKTIRLSYAKAVDTLIYFTKQIVTQ